MKNAIDNNLTIILSLKGRPGFTFRWMEYAASINLPFKVVIVDGGDDKDVEERLSSSKSYNQVRYKYYRFPYDESYLDYFSKLETAFDHVETDYVVMADNDDFFVIDGLRKNVEFLMENSDYISCGGEVGGLFFDNDECFEFGVSSNKQNNITSESSMSRVLSHFNSYDATYYDVHRTEQLKKCFSKLRVLNPSDLFVAELITSCMTVASGKVKKDNYLHLVRQNNSPGSGAAGAHKKGGFLTRMCLPNWSTDYHNFIELLAAELSHNEDLVEETKVALDQSYNAFLLKNIQAEFLNEVSFTTRIIVKYMLQHKKTDARSIRNMYFRKIYSIVCRVKYRNGKPNLLGRALYFYNDVAPIAKVLNKP